MDTAEIDQTNKDYYKEKKKNAHKNFTDKVKQFKDALNDGLEVDLPEAPAAELPEESDEQPMNLDIEKMQRDLEDAKKLSAEYLDKLRRNMAEFDNFRKRTAKEKSVMYDEGVRDTFERLIPVLDNFELALHTATDKEDNFYKGIDMILRQFKTTAFDLGIEEIAALGVRFDPNEHNAVAHVSDNAFGEHEIIEEMRKGYRYKDKVIRPSMVKVAN